jgi:alkylation response protein AidB-like acyl-CoA dehydrogenase
MHCARGSSRVAELAERIRALQWQGSLDLPLPAAGATAERHRTLMQFGRMDLSVARIVEAHTDAIAILAEQGRAGQLNALYGVWASDGPQSKVIAASSPDGGWRLSGVKQYCSGGSLVDAALVTAHAEAGLLLFEVPLHLAGITLLPSTWVTGALADTTTVPVSFDCVELPPTAVVGAAFSYLRRPGFWHGAIGPAACWAGGALSLIDAAVELNRQDAHSRAHLGALEAIGWGFHALLAEGGREIDADPDDADAARLRALKLRHLIERWCTEVMDRFGRATGPQLLAMDAAVVRQYSALTVYIRQCHAERDLETIAQISPAPTG